MRVAQYTPRFLKRLIPDGLKRQVRSTADRLSPIKHWQFTAADYPWFDQPNALDLLEQRRHNQNLSEQECQLLYQWVTEGYCLVSGLIPESCIDSMLQDLEAVWTAKRPLQGLKIHDLRMGEPPVLATLTHAQVLNLDVKERFAARDNSNWRIHGFDAYSAGAKAIYRNPELIRLTSLIFDSPSAPQATINFMYGSAQKIHQDTAVFHLAPPNAIVGVWIACEDISPDSGPLVFYPKSHRETLFERFDNYPQTNVRTAGPDLLAAYYQYIDALTEKYERRPFLAKKGDIFLWHGMLLHGGSEIKNTQLTRKSYVIHYMPPQANVHYQIVGPFNW